MNKQSQIKKQLDQPDQPGYKDQPLPDTRSKKEQSAQIIFKEGRTVKSFKEMGVPLN